MVKVLDFGISKALHGVDASQMQMTASAAIMGSPQYMSPEQIRSSKNVDARADVWALGVILHELLTGAPAYQADTVPGLLAMIVADAPPPLSSQRPDAPRDLENCVLRCLEKDRNLRFASVAQLARALEPYASPYSQLLVRRIVRILGDDSPPPTVLTPEAHPLEATVSEPTGQTNGSWTRTGSRTGSASVGNVLPLYRRPNVQMGAGLGAATLAVLGALLFVRPTTPESDPALGEESQAAALTPASQATPQTVAPGVAAPMRAPSVGVVRTSPAMIPPTGERGAADETAGSPALYRLLPSEKESGVTFRIPMT
jgi:serine/threonine-protein kinase